MAQFGDVLAGDVLAFEEVEDEPAPAASARRASGGCASPTAEKKEAMRWG